MIVTLDTTCSQEGCDKRVRYLIDGKGWCTKRGPHPVEGAALVVSPVPSPAAVVEDIRQRWNIRPGIVTPFGSPMWDVAFLLTELDVAVAKITTMRDLLTNTHRRSFFSLGYGEGECNLCDAFETNLSQGHGGPVTRIINHADDCPVPRIESALVAKAEAKTDVRRDTILECNQLAVMAIELDAYRKAEASATVDGIMQRVDAAGEARVLHCQGTVPGATDQMFAIEAEIRDAVTALVAKSEAKTDVRRDTILECAAMVKAHDANNDEQTTGFALGYAQAQIELAEMLREAAG